ncbi:hypothetical protein TCAL_10328 [Tigriopus californicus]|uniref:Fe2OG dioxygenase domain-containing protein n=1 Tax=Tigriopus californicus TaxID=6832 RepID=A0A553NFE6_TIGCA|nr:phytanoyl-CoA dioxygenase domain-containing protein 1 homolog [Tigriopus californicus]TRY64173.1 hypothetical protein TCAL_10328 [Tigriopus californicus]|eukprot:TCALIF_10328-PA protein Name:"Similar to PHYHD1 Phytanoyl-CoA dioxygenase domain-containing protein 1 (Homo sapiens)" AED:0.20 eAED:0.20 QI:138/1/1/1/1/1/5/169/289
MAISQAKLDQFIRDGLVVIEDVLSIDEVNTLKESCLQLVREMDPKEHHGVFSTTSHNQAKDDYFLESGDKIRFFFEKDTVDEDTLELKLPKEDCLNKIGHALHWLEPNFKKITFGSKMKDVASSIGLKKPVVVQGMYIFKQPRVGSEVTPHQDGTFLRNDPLNLVGFWFPIDDATLENGCLWYIPGSHKLQVSRHFVRNPKKEMSDEPLMVFHGENPPFNDSAWVAAPVKKGSLVLIHGQVLHKSEANNSTQPRHAYTFHMVETDGCQYSKNNWLQPTPELPFPFLFEN